ncbi:MULTISPECIES: hypothetical protein [unclassified Fibrobacter]|uniref:hypothetical protein n=1 Tax=unclassified Fibrobacter TaxID=2634177 RepID=UPI00091CA0A4|nr:MULTISPECIES: hypothetical protein [Fibrobacter]MCL4102478.1 hypothetical protein [Fibrobacter succinogenes]OWV06384.1 hypothetical protein B7993_05520 [Fibrobacter sp. UWH3]SHL51787.1 hypothetical protein SAMN05720765_11638 [Fibrobacter sp. UWH6]
MFAELINALLSHRSDDEDDDEDDVRLTPERVQSEIGVLKRKNVPDNVYHIYMGEKPYAVFAARTKRNLYTLHMDLRRFPNDVPKVFVTQMLKDRDGNRLDSCDGSMHVLDSEHGWTRICHYGNASWNPGVSLYKIYVKCCLWLNMYELHLETGNDIDYYLNHQS